MIDDIVKSLQGDLDAQAVHVDQLVGDLRERR